MKDFLMALDEGTTSARCIIFDRNGKIAGQAAAEFKQYFPKESYVEQDASEIFDCQLSVAREAICAAGLRADDIAGIGITNQRETVVVWEKGTGKPICPAIVWQCRRTAPDCEKLRKSGLSDLIREKTGLPIDPYFSATKLAWILRQIPGARERANRGELLFGTMDSYLLYRLTGGRVHATDPSNAARTMLFNINTLSFDDELLRLFDIPACMMPRVLPSCGLFGETDACLFGRPLPVTGIAGDQQAALFGQCCFTAGSIKNTYGTGGFLLMNTGERRVDSESGLLSTIGWQINGRTTYVLEGSVFVCGAAIQWLRDGLGLLASAAESEALAARVSDTGGVYFVPAFAGLGTPYWDPYARGAIVGITRGTTKAHLVRATLEAMAYQTADVVEAMRRDTGLPVSELRVDGGASANRLLLSLQSDLLGIPILRPACIETTAFGAACLSGLAAGVFADESDISRLTQTACRFTPTLPEPERLQKLRDWHRAVESVLCFAHP